MMCCVSVLAGLTFIVLLSKHQQPNITIGSCHSQEYGRHTHYGMIISNYELYLSNENLAQALRNDIASWYHGYRLKWGCGAGD